MHKTSVPSPQLPRTCLCSGACNMLGTLCWTCLVSWLWLRCLHVKMSTFKGIFPDLLTSFAWHGTLSGARIVPSTTSAWVCTLLPCVDCALWRLSMRRCHKSSWVAGSFFCLRYSNACSTNISQVCHMQPNVAKMHKLAKRRCVC